MTTMTTVTPTRGRNRLPQASSEYAETAALWQWVYALEGQHPALRLALHCPNEGARAPWRARQIGLRAGVPDVLILSPSHDGSAAGLALELKWGKGKPTADQREWLARLTLAGWTAEVVYMTEPGGWVEAARMIAIHLGLPGEVLP